MTLATLAPYFVVVVGAMLALLGLYVLVRAHRDRESPINLAHLLIDGTLSPPRVTLAKATGLGAFLLSSWLMVLLGVEGKVDANLMAVYIVGWGAVKVAGDVTSLRERALVSRVDNPDA